MDKQQAVKIMGVNEGATKDEIIKRYDILLRKNRGTEKDNSDLLKEITDAYNLLMGYDFYDPKAEAIRKHKQENPNKLLKKMNIDQNKFENFMHYHKWHIVLGVLAFFILFFTVKEMVTRKPLELTVDVIGNIYSTSEDENALKNSIMERLPQLKESQVQILTVTDGMDGQMEYAIQTKIIIEFTAGGVDIFILDEEYFARASEEGLFSPLEDLIPSLKVDASQIGVKGAIVERDIDGKIENQGEELIYGLDVTDSKFLSDSGIVGDRMIAGIKVNSKHYDNAVETLKLLLE